MTIITIVKIDLNDRISHCTLENELDFKPPLIIVYCKLDFKNNNKMINYWKNRLQRVAVNHKDLSFVISDLTIFAQSSENMDSENIRNYEKTALLLL